MKETSSQIAAYLLQIKAIKLSPANPFTWASGIKSPIYCDNRKTLSYPEIRTYIKNAFLYELKDKFPQTEIVAGVATGAIAQGALLADAADLPFVYVRAAPKGHGLENMIEGEIKQGQKVVVIEDLISTGQSSLKAVEALRNAGLEVLGMLAIFTYNFEIAMQNFKKENVLLHTLSDYDKLIDIALKSGYINENQSKTLLTWRVSPETWK